jgi:hypothetical protein
MKKRNEKKNIRLHGKGKISWDVCTVFLKRSVRSRRREKVSNSSIFYVYSN